MMRLNDTLNANDASRAAILFEGETFTYAGLDALSNRFAHGFAVLGIKPQDRVTLLLGNTPLMIAAYFGAFKSGVVANPLHERLSPDEVAYIVDHAGSKLIVTSDHFETVLAEALSQIDNPPPVLCFGESRILTCISGTLLDEQPDDSFQADTTAEDDAALLLYTSGTTGRPKGVLLTHGNVLAGGRTVGETFGLKKTDRTMCVMPLSHTNALMFSTIPFLMAGASVVLCRRFSASKHWDMCRRYAVNSFSASPAILTILLEGDSDDSLETTDLDYVKVASAPTSVELAERFEVRYGKGLLIETYGLTETTAISISNPLDGRRKFGSIGKAVIDHEARIVDETGKPLPAGEVGELTIKGPTVMKEYFKDPDATAATVRDGWVYSGDVARMDDEGYIYIVGRKKELIIRGGENISPLEVDQVLTRHPAVHEAAAVGIPNRIWGEVVAACVVRRTEVTEADLISFCSEFLTSFKIPEKIAFVDELPRNAIGKFVRSALVPYLVEPTVTEQEDNGGTHD